MAKPKEDPPRTYTGAKRGPKPGTKRPSYTDDRKIKSIPAQQVGIKRDPLVAMLFG